MTFISQRIASASSNIGNSDLTISAAGERKLIMAGATSADVFAIKESTDTNPILNVQGDGIVQVGNVFQAPKTNSRLEVLDTNNTRADLNVITDFTVGSGSARIGAWTTAVANRGTFLYANFGGDFGGGSSGLHFTTSSDAGHFCFSENNNGRGWKFKHNLGSTPSSSDNASAFAIFGGGTSGVVSIGTSLGRGDTGAHTSAYGANILSIMKAVVVPTSTYTDCATLYTDDIVAGNAAIHAYTEGGDTVKLYSQDNSVSAATFVANTSGISDDTATYGGFTMGQIAQALINNGLLK